MSERILLGEVGVDSGQLLICDPGYIDGLWGKDAVDPNLRQVYEDKITGKLYQCTCLQDGTSKPNIIGFKTYGEKISECDDNTPNELIKSGRWVEKLMPPPPCRGKFSYWGCCDASSRTGEMGGQLYYPLGHAGIGVAFRSGFGDGCYQVWGTLEDIPNWGKRLTKVEIILIDEEYKQEHIDRMNELLP
jgi:hypothetical protein